MPGYTIAFASRDISSDEAERLRIFLSMACYSDVQVDILSVTNLDETNTQYRNLKHALKLLKAACKTPATAPTITVVNASEVARQLPYSLGIVAVAARRRWFGSDPIAALIPSDDLLERCRNNLWYNTIIHSS